MFSIVYRFKVGESNENLLRLQCSDILICQNCSLNIFERYFFKFFIFISQLIHSRAKVLTKKMKEISHQAKFLKHSLGRIPKKKLKFNIVNKSTCSDIFHLSLGKKCHR